MSMDYYKKLHGCCSYNVLLLKRDRLALRPWGFEIGVHEFGGACLVERVSVCSPAECAVDIGGFHESDNNKCHDDNRNHMGLKVKDMIICMNGQMVGGMTQLEFAIQLEIS